MKQTNLEWLLTLETDAIQIAADKFSEISCNGNSADSNYCEYLRWLQKDHVEPIILTPEERKAAELAVAIGLPWIKRTDNFVFLMEGVGDYGRYKSISADQIPVLEPLRFMLVIEKGAEPLDLRTLLKETT